MSQFNGAQADAYLDDLEEQFFDDGLSDLERRRSLEREGRLATDIQNDLAQKGPLYLYVRARRAEATEALRILTAIDPKDTVGIAVAQTHIAEYLKACDWIHAKVEAAARAEQIIAEDYPAEQTEEDTDTPDGEH